MSLKKAFEERYRKLLGQRYDAYLKYSLSYLTRSIRVNTIKADIHDVKKRLEDKGWKLTQIPFCKEGFWVEHETGRLDIGNTREHALGYYYVQEAASMIPPLVLNPEPGDLILDMCASPGSKTTQIAQYMENTGLLIANDFTGMRMKPLGLNVERMGITNTILTRMYGQWFAKKNLQFDRILVDAPCSGTGTIRKSLKTLRIWNPTMVKRLASTQKKLISVGFEILKPGGTLVYSTCSTEPEEDESVITHLLEKYSNADLQDISLKLNRSPVILEFEGQNYSPDAKKCLRLWPQDNDTEGFFVTKVRKIV
ncbi:RsmB/NOP family class I SAM-dependent RNA methyltransferase [Candidatus Woesearchaeota archaeon]|nr:RsmB/NOP family class I SAM-dependent RNA methyltransferase [Candidatus Woesearchaeota archaeon]